MKVKQGLILNDSDCDIARLEDLDGFSDLEDDDIEEEEIENKLSDLTNFLDVVLV